MQTERRRYARLTVGLPGTLRAAATSSGAEGATSEHTGVELPIQITSLGPEGVLFEIATLDGWHRPKGRVSLEFKVAGEAVTLLATLVRDEAISGTLCRVGARFLIEVADRSSRLRYSEWIVAQLAYQDRSERETRPIRPGDAGESVPAEALNMATTLFDET